MFQLIKCESSFCVLVGVLFTVITGSLFSRSDPEDIITTTDSSTATGEVEHLALYRLLRTSENAIRWIGNKTSSSLNELITSKDQTTADGPRHPVDLKTSDLTKKKHLLSWLQKRFHFSSGSIPDSDAEESKEDDSDTLVLAHRTKDHGFSWGPFRKNLTENGTATAKHDGGGLLKATGRCVQSLWASLAQGTRSLAGRSKVLIRGGLTKVFAKKDPFLMRNYASESLDKQLRDLEKNNGTRGLGVEDIGFACDDIMKPVCAVDIDNKYTVFQNECKMVHFNYKHGTNFTVRGNDVCMDLFVRLPDLFYQNLQKEELNKS